MSLLLLSEGSVSVERPEIVVKKVRVEPRYLAVTLSVDLD